MRSIFIAPIVVAVAALASGGAAAAGDAAKGQAAARVCVSCHGAEGISRFPDIPHLAGQNQAYLVATINALRRSGLGQDLSGRLARRSDVTMEHQAVGSTAKDIEDIASYYSSLACAMPTSAGGERMPAVGGRCVSCHGEGGRSVTVTVPRLAGQHRVYLENQLKAFQNTTSGAAGQRRERFHPMMSRQDKKLTDDDIVTLAGYFAHQPCQ